LVEDTRIDYDEDQVTYPFIPNHKKSFYITPLTYVQEGSPFFSHFTNYCYNTYGLMDQEISYVWDHYSDIINHKINSKPMNESIDNKKEIYLNKIVQYMVEDTKIDYDREEIRLPFFLLPPSFSSFLSSFFPRSFSNYVKDTYGLTEQEVKYVWERYNRIVVDKVNQK
jgi:hypothetical protein